MKGADPTIWNPRGPYLLVLAFLFTVPPQDGRTQTTQTTTEAARYFNVQSVHAPSARAAAMGSAFTGVSDDVSALLSDPAGLSFLTEVQVLTATGLGWSESFQGTALIGLPLGPKAGAGFCVLYQGYGTLEGRDDLGSLTPSYGADDLTLQAGLGFLVLPDISLGASLKGSMLTLAGESSLFLTPEIGLLVEPRQGLKLGVLCSVPGLGPTGVKILSSLKMGFSWARDLDASTRFLTALAYLAQFDSVDHLQGGVEVSLERRYFLRVGYQTPLESGNYGGFFGFTFGAGLDLSGFTLDYAFLPSGDLGSSHRIDLGYRFEGPVQGPRTPGQPASRGPSQGPGAKENKPFSGDTSPSPTTSSSGISSQLPPLSKPPQDGTGDGGSSLAPSGLGEVPGVGPKPVQGEEAKDSLTVRFKIPSDPVAQADLLRSQGRAQEASLLYKQALQQDPANVQAWRGLGSLYVRAGQKAAALQCLERALQLKPEDEALRTWVEKFKKQ